MARAGHADNRVMTELPAEYSRTNLSSDPIYRYLRITKGGPGGVPGTSAEQDLVDSAWLQRLRRIHQLQSAWWVFATAEHSRFQHALGAMHLAGEWARHLYPSLAASCSGTPSPALVEETMRMAGLLHDVGHGPFGHFFDENYLDTWGIDHEVIGRALITGPLADLVAGLGASPNADFEPRERIDPRWVAYLIAGPDLAGVVAPSWLTALTPALVGAYSADNMDYVPRDSYICGVAAGPVDVQRILHYSFISERGLTLHAHAAEALYMFLSARLYLYHQVYFHRTVRRIDLQLREVFRPTVELVLGGNPLERLDDYLMFTEWALLKEVNRWALGEGDAGRGERGRTGSPASSSGGSSTRATPMRPTSWARRSVSRASSSRACSARGCRRSWARSSSRSTSPRRSRAPSIPSQRPPTSFFTIRWRIATSRAACSTCSGAFRCG